MNLNQWFSESFRGLTLPVIQIKMDGLVLAEGTEGNHVLMRMESYSSKRRCIAQLRVHSNLVTCTTDIHIQPSLGFFFVFQAKVTQKNLQTCLRVPHVCKSIFTAWKDEASTGSVRAVDSLPVVCGTNVFLHCKTVKQFAFIFDYYPACWYYEICFLRSHI